MVKIIKMNRAGFSPATISKTVGQPASFVEDVLRRSAKVEAGEVEEG